MIGIRANDFSPYMSILQSENAQMFSSFIDPLLVDYVYQTLDVVDKTKNTEVAKILPNLIRFEEAKKAKVILLDKDVPVKILFPNIEIIDLRNVTFNQGRNALCKILGLHFYDIFVTDSESSAIDAIQRMVISINEEHVKIVGLDTEYDVERKAICIMLSTLTRCLVLPCGCLTDNVKQKLNRIFENKEITKCGYDIDNDVEILSAVGLNLRNAVDLGNIFGLKFNMLHRASMAEISSKYLSFTKGKGGRLNKIFIESRDGCDYYSVSASWLKYCTVDALLSLGGMYYLLGNDDKYLTIEACNKMIGIHFTDNDKLIPLYRSKLKEEDKQIDLSQLINATTAFNLINNSFKEEKTTTSNSRPSVIIIDPKLLSKKRGDLITQGKYRMSTRGIKNDIQLINEIAAGIGETTCSILTTDSYSGKHSVEVRLCGLSSNGKFAASKDSSRADAAEKLLAYISTMSF